MMRQPKRIVGRPPRWPLAIERALTADLKKLVAAMDAAARTAVARHGQAMLDAGRVRGDQDEPQQDPSEPLNSLLFEVSAAVAGALLLLLQAIGLHARATAYFHRRDVLALIRRAYGTDILLPDEPWLQPLLRAWGDEASTSAHSVADQYTGRLRSEMGRVVIEGRGMSDLRAVVSDTTAIGRRRSAFIARDGLGRLMAQLTERRYRALGVRSFVWRTMLDEKVRPTHRVREGIEFSYDRPGPRPGAEPNCRCRAAAILPGLTVDQMRGLG